MTASASDPLARKTQADLIIDRAAQQLGLLLKEAALALRPFPPFPGAFFTYGIEVNLDGVERPDLGCIVAGEDGELYELEMKIDFGDDFGDVVDPVQVFIVLAYNALSQNTELLLERAEAPAQGGDAPS
jgi:hypothetical protein